ncbi:MAG: L,D-transpeptidase family protein [Methylococcaceae bacterium]|nr:L,D-transpeptidase family protein [Methylococcaceae bacterium]
MKYTVLLIAFLFSNICIATSEEVDYVIVNKSEKKMYLLSGGLKIREYNVVFGENPKGHKLQEGDKRTPEGRYILDYKKKESAFYKSIHISYPNQDDISSAKARGVNAGGSIMIHGQKNGFSSMSWVSQRFNWTKGCIAVTNFEMDEIWYLIKEGTPIEIVP